MTKILATAAMALMLAAPAWAQSQQGQSSGNQASNTSAKPSDIPANQLSMLDSDTLTHSTVRDATGKDIGKIENIVVDTRSGQVAYAIVSSNGKERAVPWNRLQAANQPESFTLNAGKTALDGAPTVDKKTMAELRSPSDQQRIDSYWQKVPQQAQAPEGQQKGDQNQ